MCFLLVFWNHVDRLEVAIYVDAESSPRLFLELDRNLVSTLGKITDMSVAGLDSEVGSKNPG